MAQAGHKVSGFVDFQCVRFQFRFRLAVSVSRLGFVSGICDFGFGYGFIWGFLAALYGIFAIMNGPGLGPHSKCQCYCIQAARESFFFFSLNCPRASMHLQDSFVFPFGFDFHLAVCPPIEAVVDFSEFVCKLIACGISVVHDDPP